MTPHRIKILQWFHDRGAVLNQLTVPDAPSAVWLNLLERDGQIELTTEGWTLTDQGRRELHEATQ